MRGGRWRRPPRRPASATAARASGAGAGRRATARSRTALRPPTGWRTRRRPTSRRPSARCASCASAARGSRRRCGCPSAPSAVLARNGLSRLPKPDADEPVNRYERPAPGELIHIDVKKLGRIGREGHRVNGDRSTRSRGIGWEFVHVAIDDCTRLAYVEVLDDERTANVVAFFQRAVAFFNAHGIEVQRLMTDNGSAYRSHAHAAICRQLGIRHLFTQPYRPKTNGKAERFIQTLLREWAYAAAYPTSAARRRALPVFLTRYNTSRPHKALGGIPPSQRLAERLNAAAANT